MSTRRSDGLTKEEIGIKPTKIIAVTATVVLMSTSAMAAKIAVIGGSNDDAFWNIIKKGLDDAIRQSSPMAGR